MTWLPHLDKTTVESKLLLLHNALPYQVLMYNKLSSLYAGSEGG